MTSKKFKVQEFGYGIKISNDEFVRRMEEAAAADRANYPVWKTLAHIVAEAEEEEGWVREYEATVVP